MLDGKTIGSRRALFAATAALALGAAVAPGWAVEPSAPQADPMLAEQFDQALPRFEATAIVQPTTDLAEPAPTEEEDDWTQYGSGSASYYAAKFEGRRTASGERFDNDEYTAAHRTLPFGTKVKVTRAGKSVVVRINDRGPFTRGRVIDVSQAAARDLGLLGPGHGTVTLAVLDGDA